MLWGAPLGLTSRAWYWPAGLTLALIVFGFARLSITINAWARAALITLGLSMVMALAASTVLSEDAFSKYCLPIPDSNELPASMIHTSFEILPLQSTLKCTLTDTAGTEPRPDLIWDVPLFKARQGVIPQVLHNLSG